MGKCGDSCLQYVRAEDLNWILQTSSVNSQNHRMACAAMDIKDLLVPTPCHWQGHISLDQVNTYRDGAPKTRLGKVFQGLTTFIWNEAILKTLSCSRYTPFVISLACNLVIALESGEKFLVKSDWRMMQGNIFSEDPQLGAG